MSGDPLLTILPAADKPLLDAARAVLTTSGLPPVVLIGGLAVTARLSEAGVGHRATIDIDLVTTYREPGSEASDLIADAHHSQRDPLVVRGVKVDIIPTSPVTERDLEGLDDGSRLFVAGHRWAFETGEHVRLATTESDHLDVRIATVAGLVTAKSHAVGHPNARRRATKHGSDLLDLYRLVDLHDADGSLAEDIRGGPAHLNRIVADVVDREICTNPARAATSMSPASPTPIDAVQVSDTMESFVDGLRR